MSLIIIPCKGARVNIEAGGRSSFYCACWAGNVARGSVGTGGNDLRQNASTVRRNCEHICNCKQFCSFYHRDT